MSTTEANPLTGGGERMALGASGGHTQQEHLARYHWALQHLYGDALDVACGSGYGTAIMGRAARMTGLDASEAALANARTVAPDATLALATLPEIPLADDSFDTVVSFETIEHIDDDTGFVRELARVLRPGGTLLLSTPNKDVWSPDGPPLNPYHVREYRLDHLLEVLTAAGFTAPDLLMQCPRPRTVPERVAYKFVARFPALCQPGRWWDRLGHGDGHVEPWDGTAVPKFWVLRAKTGR